MTSRLACVCIDSAHPFRLAEFWMEVLGWVEVDRDDTGVSLAAPGPTMPTLDIFRVPEAKTVKNRLHLDLRADGCSTADELDRLLGLGATRADVGHGPNVSWVVLADPEGNEFCLLNATAQEVETAAGSSSPTESP